MNIKEMFEEDGYCIISNGIDAKLVDDANASIDKFKDANFDLLKSNDLLVNDMLQRVVNLQFSVQPLKTVFLEAMYSSREICDRNGEATLYTSLFFELGSQQSLHRDTPYFYSGQENPGYMGVWVALDDVDENNGPLHVLKGSHKIGEPDLAELKNRFYPNEDVPASSTPLFNAYNDELINIAEKKGLKVELCKVNKGDIIMWDPSTLHGGMPHEDKSRSRRSFVMHITPKNMPMKNMDYFFHKEKNIEEINNSYVTIGENDKKRLILAGDEVDFMHKKRFTSSELGIF